MTYPLSVVSTVIAVNQCGLKAGTVPFTPIYGNWQDAYRHLGKTVRLVGLFFVFYYGIYTFLGAIETRF